MVEASAFSGAAEPKGGLCPTRSTLGLQGLNRWPRSCRTPTCSSLAQHHQSGQPSYATQGSREPPRQGARGGAVGPPSQPNQYHYDEEEEYLHEDDGLHPHNVAHDFGFGADMHAQQQHGEEEEKADASGGSWTWKAFVKSECACLLAC